jgi:hypothetical protein
LTGAGTAGIRCGNKGKGVAVVPRFVNGPVRGAEAASPRPLARFAGPVAGALLALVAATAARADICSQLQAQAAASGNQSEIAALNRQLAALSALERKRQCADRRGGGFFDPCGEVRQRKADVSAKLAALKGGRDAAVLKARLEAHGCLARRSRPAQSASAGPGFGRNAMLFCVRRHDGYYFPVPGSQFVDSKDYRQVVDQCRFICKSQDVDVYRLDSPSMESEEMVSVEKGTPYGELATAFLYRQASDFQGCDFQSYYRRVDEARARTVTPYDLSNALVPVPRERPDPQTASAAILMQVEPAPAEIPLDARRNVRVVGPDFFPD